MTNSERLNEYLKRQGKRQTTEREMMLEHIEHLNCHFTKSDLIENFGKVKHVSTTSIYRNMALFVEAGIVTEHNFPAPEPVYELTSRASTHCHRICTVCGEVKEFRDTQATSAIKHHRFRAFAMHSTNIYVYGICKKCLTSKTSK